MSVEYYIDGANAKSVITGITTLFSYGLATGGPAGTCRSILALFFCLDTRLLRDTLTPAPAHFFN